MAAFGEVTVEVTYKFIPKRKKPMPPKAVTEVKSSWEQLRQSVVPLPILVGVFHESGMPRISLESWHAGNSFALVLGWAGNQPVHFSPTGARRFAEFLNAMADQVEG